MKGKKKGRVEKHRGNPHGNPPSNQKLHHGNSSDENLRQSVDPGVSQSPRQKQ
jgi:hypothetical protein